MAVRKFLDENGAAQLNDLLRTKFGTKRDKTDGLVIKEITDSSVRIWDMDDGVYKLPTSCIVYYYGATNTSHTFTISTTGWLFVTHYSTTYKFYYILCADNLATRYLYNGYVTSTDGSSKNFNLGSTYLTKISSYVKNNLTYSTSNTTYALSAYQGYLLNQNKADKTELPSNFTGTDGTTTGTAGLVPAPTTSDTDKYLKSDGTWKAITPGEENVIESISVNGTAQTITNKNVDLTVPQITYSTTDLTPGTSALNTGEIYVVYE